MSGDLRAGVVAALSIVLLILGGLFSLEHADDSFKMPPSIIEPTAFDSGRTENPFGCRVMGKLPPPRSGHAGTWHHGTGESVGSSPAREGDTYRGDGIFKSEGGGLIWNLLPATSTDLPQESDQPFDYTSGSWPWTRPTCSSRRPTPPLMA